MDNEYFFDYPIWIIAPKGCAEQAEIGRGEALGGDAKNGGRYVAVFTDRDLAERVIGSGAASMGEIPDAESYLRFLEQIKKAGFTHLAFDPSPSSTKCRFLIEVDDAIKDIRGSLS